MDFHNNIYYNFYVHLSSACTLHIKHLPFMIEIKHSVINMLFHYYGLIITTICKFTNLGQKLYRHVGSFNSQKKFGINLFVAIEKIQLYFHIYNMNIPSTISRNFF